MRRRGLAAVAAIAVALAAVVAGCGADDDNGARDLRFFIFNEPGGGPQDAAQKCSEDSDGDYRIQFEYLPADADQQREQLVRRLGAEDSSLDIIGMDIIWTGEFANAGWIERVPQDRQDAFTENVFDSVLETARFEGDLYNVPIWSNTQLLWYRSDRVDSPPETWEALLEEAERIGPEEGKIQVQANFYEGLVVWANAMIESAGTTILSGQDNVGLEREPTEKALELMGRVAGGPFAPPDIDTSDEESAGMGFEDGDSSFMVNYPFVYPATEENAPDVFENMEAAKYPGIEGAGESAPPLGGINLAVSAYSGNKDLAWDAVECLIQEENQIEIAEAGGLPPVREDLYDRPAIRDVYPGFADIVAESIRDAAPRPAQSPAYQDLSLGLQRGIHPASGLDPEEIGPAYDRLKRYVERAIEREGLL
jgi:multiple sugar transport system substrate-binding protein